MPIEKTPIKKRLHARNRNLERYDLEALKATSPDLTEFIKQNKYGDDSVDFSSLAAVRALNKALLHHYYGIKDWDFPETYLCPPIPGRADYVHHMADVLAESNFGTFPDGKNITCFDLGTGASCIYPILGAIEYDWNFIASDIDEDSLKFAQKIIDSNSLLEGKIELVLQENPEDAFFGILTKDHRIDLSICNPRFHASAEEAESGSKRKIKNLTGAVEKEPILNFSGTSNELICTGGERGFIQNMITESQKFSQRCYWFSTLVSKQSNLKFIHKALKHAQAKDIKTVPMGTGNKSTRVVAWTFLSKEEQNSWRETRWKND